MARRPPDPITERVQAAVAAAQASRQALQTAYDALPLPERADALVPVVLDLLQQMAGVQAVLVPVAAQMDQLLRWQQEIEAWQAETNGRLLFASPPIGRRA